MATAEAFRTRPVTASVGVFESQGRGFAIGDAGCAASQKRENAVAGIPTFLGWRLLSA
jgi:hypothetical protein